MGHIVCREKERERERGREEERESYIIRHQLMTHKGSRIECGYSLNQWFSTHFVMAHLVTHFATHPPIGRPGDDTWKKKEVESH